LSVETGARDGKRSVTQLSKAQLARKRANDREAQRNIRQRTKEHIESLEKKVEELEGSMQRVLQRNIKLEAEVGGLRLPQQRFPSVLSQPPARIRLSSSIPKDSLQWVSEAAIPRRIVDTPLHIPALDQHMSSEISDIPRFLLEEPIYLFSPDSYDESERP
jgi:hypothetical protein